MLNKRLFEPFLCFEPQWIQQYSCVNEHYWKDKMMLNIRGPWKKTHAKHWWITKEELEFLQQRVCIHHNVTYSILNHLNVAVVYAELIITSPLLLVTLFHHHHYYYYMHVLCALYTITMKTTMHSADTYIMKWIFSKGWITNQRFTCFLNA